MSLKTDDTVQVVMIRLCRKEGWQIREANDSHYTQRPGTLHRLVSYQALYFVKPHFNHMEGNPQSIPWSPLLFNTVA